MKIMPTGKHRLMSDFMRVLLLISMFLISVPRKMVIRPIPDGSLLLMSIGTGLLVTGNPLICFAALKNIHDDFESPGKLSQYRKDAKSANTHTNNVKPRDLVNLNIDLGQMGVGGDDSWGAHIHPQYRLLDKKYEYSFRIHPIVKDDDILKLAKEKF